MKDGSIRYVLIISLILFIILVIWLLMGVGQRYVSNLSGSQVVPPEYNPLSSGSIVFKVNAKETKLSYLGLIKDIPYKHINSVGLYIEKIGKNGDRICKLDYRPNTTLNSIIEGKWNISSEILSHLKTKNIYTLVEYRGGSLRGQLMLI